MSKLDEYLAGKKKNKQRNKDTLNENTLNEGFREMPESDDPMERWWDGLQKTLDDADCDLDLGLPEDLCRLEILDMERVAADEYNFRAHYATDPERRPIDLADRSSESILSRQRVGMPDRSTLEHIYTAAQEGRLFVRSQRDYNPRQVTADAQGKSGVGHDIFNMTPDEADIGAVWEEPEKPKKPGFFTRVKAFFGNKNAKKTIKIYNLKVEDYQNKMQYWNRAKEFEAENPQMVMHSRNLVLCNQLYYGDTENNGEERLDYGIKLQDMHREGVIRSLPAEKRDAARDLDDLQDRMNEYVNQLCSHKDNVVNAQEEAAKKDKKASEWNFEEQPLDAETKEALAGLLFCRAQQKRATCVLDGDNDKRYMRFTGDELREAVKRYQNSPEFQQAIAGRNHSMLHEIYTCDPEELNTVADRVMEAAFTKQPEQKLTDKSNDVSVKQNQKELEESGRKNEMSLGGISGNYL